MILKIQKHKLYEIINGKFPEDLLARLKEVLESVLESSILLSPFVNSQLARINGKALVQSFYDFWENIYGKVPVFYCENPGCTPDAIYIGKPSKNTPELREPDEGFKKIYGFKLEGLIFINELTLLLNSDGRIEYRAVAHESLHKVFEEQLSRHVKSKLMAALELDNPTFEQLKKRIGLSYFDMHKRLDGCRDYSQFNLIEKLGCLDEFICCSFLPEKIKEFQRGTFTLAGELSKASYKVQEITDLY